MHIIHPSIHPSIPLPCKHTPHFWPPPTQYFADLDEDLFETAFLQKTKATWKSTFGKQKVPFTGRSRAGQAFCFLYITLFVRLHFFFFYGFLLFPYLRSTLPSALDAFIITVMNPAFKITVPLIASLSSEPENQDSKCNGNFGTSPLLIGFFFSPLLQAMRVQTNLLEILPSGYFFN